MSDRYHGSAYRSSGGRAPAYRDDHRRYPAPRHPRDEHDYPDNRYDARDTYAASSYYPGYAERPHGRRVHKTIPPPRPWDYSRRPPPRTEQDRIELEREREAWEAKEEERYKQRMEERERERQREWDRYGAYPTGREAEVYERERARHADMGAGRMRQRSRSPDPRYEQRGSWGRASVGSSDGREREMTNASISASAADRADAAGGYPARRSSPPPAPSSELAVAATPSHTDTSEGPASASRYRPASASDRPSSPPRGPAGFISAPPTGPRASRGAPPSHPGPSAFRARDGGPYTPDREASSFATPASARFRGGPPQAYRGGYPFGRARRDTNPYDDEAYAGSSPHESPYSPAAHLAPRLSRTSSSQTSTPAVVPSPSTLQPPTAPRFSSAHTLTPDLDAELLTLESQRSAFISNYVFGAKRASLRAMQMELRDAELELATASNRRHVVERALDVAKETADAYSLEENRKDELQRLMAQQLQQGAQAV